MIKIEARKMYRSNGLIDDIVVYGTPEDYVSLSDSVQAAVSSSEPTILETSSITRIEISRDNEAQKLFTSLQNESNEYFSHKEWEERNILRVIGSDTILNQLSSFLHELSSKGEGYSYISEYSDSSNYSSFSPEWRLHVENT